MLQNRFNSAMALREKNTNPSSSREKAPTIADAALLGFISSLGPFAVNANVPGFHAIAADMGVSFIAVQLSLTVYLATYAVASLFVGAVSDSLGRKPVIIAGMLLFMAASLGAALATTIEVFYFWRFVQGLTAAAGQVVTQAVVRDRWAGLGAARMNALIAMFFAGTRSRCGRRTHCAVFLARGLCVSHCLRRAHRAFYCSFYSGDAPGG